MGTPQNKVYLTRVVEFAAAHRLYQEKWSEEANRELYGPCANPYGHGHNYVLEATFAGERDPETGMIVHLSAIKSMLKELVEIPLDHRHMNHDVSFLKGVLPTLENIVMVLWDRLSGSLKDQSYSLHKLRLSSSDRNWVEYFGPAQA